MDIRPGCKLIFKGNAVLAGGISLRNDNGGITVFGENFACNSYCFITSNTKVEFGDDCVLGWNINIRDSDGHAIYYSSDPDKKEINSARPVKIGNHVWIAAHVNILKGTEISENCIVAYGSLLVGNKVLKHNCIIGGYPIRVLKEDIAWRF